MKKNILFICLLLAAGLSTYAQVINAPVNMGGGEYVVRPSECITDAQRAAIKAMLKTNVQRLIEQGKLKPAADAKKAPPKFKWPLKQAAGYDYNYYYGISNYIDHDATYPDHVQDYNCGTRTYDLSSGYNHQGTDIFLWPFSWLQMQRKQVKIVAAAKGVIIAKSDGNFDQNCGFTGTWNAVYVQHADGSVVWYGHMKKNSLTTKNVGDNVGEGETLGYVGSSGNSTGPHLHFEVYDAGNNLVDPWKGSCNTISSSWWDKQKPYYESKMNTVLTGSAAPLFPPTCPDVETTNESSHFTPGSKIYFSSYYHDQKAGQLSLYKVTRPDNSVFAQWTHSSTLYYEASYWYWWYTLPANAPLGKWKFQVIFQGDTLTRTFTVASTFAVQDIYAAEKNNAALKSLVNNVVLSPNPAVNNLKVSIENAAGIIQYKILDVNGKLFGQGKFDKKDNTLSIATLPAGTYCLQFSGNDGGAITNKKFVKL